MKRLLLLPMAAFAAVGLTSSSFAAALLPEIVFKDNFDAPAATTDINDNAAARESGALAPLDYTVNGTVELSPDGSPGLIKLGNNTYFSPNFNFTGGGTFSIEFDANPGADDDPSDGLSGDWNGIVFGASSQNVFMNASDGVGILFRNNGDIQTFAGTAAVGGGPGITGGLPRDRAFHVKIDVVTADFNGSPVTVTMTVDGQPVAIGAAAGTTLTKASGFRNNFITLEGIGAWGHTFDNLQISAVPSVQVAPSSVSINRATALVSDPVSITIPAQLNATAAAQIKVTSSNPLVAVPTGADASGSLTLNFSSGGARTQTFTVTSIAPGSATMRVEAPTDVQVSGNVAVFVIAGVGVDELLFQDNFNAPDGTAGFDINLGLDVRQTGTAKNTAYSEAANTAPGGANDDNTQISPDSFTGKLLIVDAGAGVSPMRNFNDGPEFYIEVEINPGANVTDHSSDNWSAIVFGTRSPNSFVISADGFGILFRNNGAIEVWDAGTRVFSSALGILPEPPFKVRIDSKAVNFAGAPATISLKVNNQTMPLTATSDTYIKSAGFYGNYITVEGTGPGLEHVFDDLTLGAKSCINFRDSSFETTAGQSVSSTVQIPASLTATAAAVVKVKSSNPAVANVTGAVNGEVTLTFAIGQNSLPITIDVTGAGQARFELSNALGICMGEALIVNSRTALVRNPSFELNYNPGFPHYSDVLMWDKTGNTGVNDSSGPFADNGVIPDQSRAAFLQGSASLSQTISNLTAGKKYWVQYRYNARGCCGGTIDLSAQIDDVEIDKVTNVKAQGEAGYGFRSAIFTAANATAKLGFVTTANGDATAVIDAVSVTQRDDGNVVLENPSFEASGDAALASGIILPRLIAGWTATGTVGLTIGGALAADNGKTPDQDHVAFLQGVGTSLAQTARRLTAGSSYKLQWNYNGSVGKTGHLQVKIGGNIVKDLDVVPVGGAEPYRSASVDFVAAGTTADISFESAADSPVLLDNIQLLGQAITLPCLGVTPAKTELSLNQTTTISITVPPQLIAAGPATIKLKSANSVVAALEGAAADGVLSVTFDAGGETTKTVNLQAAALGRTTIDVLDPAGLCVDNGVEVSVIGALIRNPSFESNLAGNFPGYGPIDSWTGGSGLNNITGPFHDNGQLPDRKQIAFIQGNGSLSQAIANLTVGKHYWIQFRYNVRDCCGGTIGVTVRFNEVDLLTIDSVTAVHSPNEYYYGQAEFTADVTSGMLSFVTTAAGDATLLLDAITIVQRDEGQVIVQNPSFEAEGAVAFPGYLSPDSISGWTATGGYGVNVSGVGPFADNGKNPDQDSVAFLQGVGSLSQKLTGLTANANYTAKFAVNARTGNTPRLKVTFDGASLLEEDLTPVGGGNAYATKQVTFTAAGEEGVLKFEQVAAGDNTVLLDNLTVTQGGVVDNRPTLTGVINSSGILHLSWPVSATGYNLVSSATVNGTYTAVVDPVLIEGNNNTVSIQPTGAARFYQLKK